MWFDAVISHTHGKAGDDARGMTNYSMGPHRTTSDHTGPHRITSD